MKNRTKQAFLPVSSCFDIVSKTTTICAGGNEKAFASGNERGGMTTGKQKSRSESIPA